MSEKNRPTQGSGYKIGIWGLTTIVFSMMVGGGIFNIAQTMAARASLGAVLSSWLICGLGVVSLILTFITLVRKYPEMNAGIYQYAGAFGGKYLEFNVAWGYWLTIPASLVAYCVMLNDSLGAFFPVFLNHGLPTLVFGLTLIWGMGVVMLSGVKSATRLNTMVTFMKLMLILSIAGILVIYAKVGAMKADFWGESLNLGGFGTQIRSDMAMCIWCFIGIEGAVMMSSRAKRREDVPRASVSGFVLALILYMLVSALCFGIMSQPELAKLPNPSMAYVLKSACGDWAYYFVIGSASFSILGSWLSWTMVCAHALYGASKAGIMPSHFMKTNSREVPYLALLLACTFMSFFLMLVCLSDSLFMSAVKLTSVLALPSYFFSACLLLKLWVKGGKNDWKELLIGCVCLVFTIWILYAAGLKLLMMSSLLYLAAIAMYIGVRSDKNTPGIGKNYKLFDIRDRIVLAVIIIAAVASVVCISCGIPIF